MASFNAFQLPCNRAAPTQAMRHLPREWFHFDTITNGRGLMGSYGANIPVRDRWAIVAYIRALQHRSERSAPSRSRNRNDFQA
jgi:hypothetical protein